MEINDQQLLQQFVETRNEEAFASLLNRHLGLVLGAASRQLGGDHHAAEDLAQQVFTQLALKAPKLLDHPCLEAWLHKATRLACLEQIRLKARRDRREREALVNLFPTGEKSSWEDIAPVLDEALEGLAEADRSLILMRHINRQSGQQLAARLGISESAARKQLERAMGRLRDQLTRRGVAVSAVVLVAALDTNLQAQVPAGLAGQIAKHALTQSAVATSASWLNIFKVRLAIPAMILILASVVLLKFQTAVPSPASATTPALPQLSTLSKTQTPLVVESMTNEPKVQAFTLRVVDSETGEAIPGVSALFFIEPEENRMNQAADQQWATNGLIHAEWTKGLYGFSANVSCEGYADTHIHWIKEQEPLSVPESWTLRLNRAPKISGTVVDPQGVPIASAKVIIWALGDFYLPVPGTSQPSLSYPLRLMNVQTNTDVQGHWSFSRMAREVQNAGFVIAISHPDYLSSQSDTEESQVSAMQSGEYVAVLTPHQSDLVTGVVFDPSGKPLTNAVVTDGVCYPDPNTRGGQSLGTDAQGKFAFRTHPDWKQMVTAKAPGYAPKTLSWSGQPLSIKLQPGASLRLRIVSQSGQPIEGVEIVNVLIPSTSTQYELRANTDSEGRVSWEDVPDEPLLMSFMSQLTAYRSRCGEFIQPTNKEQTFVLQEALKITGTVLDADTYSAIPTFRVAWVDTNDFGSIPAPAPFALPNEVSGRLFEQGEFELIPHPSGEYLSSTLNGALEKQHFGGYAMFTAEGYAAFTSRFIDINEGAVNLQITLKSAKSTKVQVLDPSGTPVANAAVAACASAAPLQFKGRAWKASGDYVLATDGNGFFNLPADESLQTIIITDPARTLLGWANAQTLRKQTVIRLSKLRTLELSVALPENESQPAPAYLVELSNSALLPFTSDVFPMSTQTSSDGKCSFPKLPAGLYQINLLKAPLTTEKDKPSVASFPLEIKESDEDPVCYRLPATENLKSNSSIGM